MILRNGDDSGYAAAVSWRGWENKGLPQSRATFTWHRVVLLHIEMDEGSQKRRQLRAHLLFRAPEAHCVEQQLQLFRIVIAIKLFLFVCYFVQFIDTKRGHITWAAVPVLLQKRIIVKKLF